MVYEVGDEGECDVDDDDYEVGPSDDCGELVGVNHRDPDGHDGTHSGEGEDE